MRRWLVGLAAAVAAMSPPAFGATFTVNDDTISGRPVPPRGDDRRKHGRRRRRDRLLHLRGAADDRHHHSGLTACRRASGPNHHRRRDATGYSARRSSRSTASAAGAFAPGLILGGGGLIRAVVDEPFQEGSEVRSLPRTRDGASRAATSAPNMTGTVDRGNRAVLTRPGASNVIGGTGAFDGNVISGNNSRASSSTPHSKQRRRERDRVGLHRRRRARNARAAFASRRRRANTVGGSRPAPGTSSRDRRAVIRLGGRRAAGHQRESHRYERSGDGSVRPTRSECRSQAVPQLRRTRIRSAVKCGGRRQHDLGERLGRDHV